MKRKSIRITAGHGPFLLATLTAITGIYLSTHLQSRIAETESTAARLTAETLRLHAEQEFTLFGEVLESVRALHALSDEVNQAAMNEFIEKGLVHQHAVLGAFGLAQRVSPQLRRQIEAKKEVGPGSYRIVQQSPNGTWVPAKHQTAYHPLTWQSRTQALHIPIGFDFSSQPEARKTIQQIERTRQTAIVQTEIEGQRSKARGQKSAIGSQISNVGNRQSSLDSSPPSYWVFAPIIPDGGSSMTIPAGNLIGFSVARLQPDAILQRVSTHASSSPELHLTITNPLDPKAKESIQLTREAWIYRGPMKALGAQWIFECSLPITASNRHPEATLVAGLTITGLLMALFLILGGRTKKIEAIVRIRTEELNRAKRSLEENLIERAHIEDKMNELADHERRRIGCDLHDSLGQKLTGAVFLSRSLLNYFGSGQEEQKKHAATLNQTLKSAVAQVRDMARGLAPVTLNDERLIDALKQLAEEMTNLYGVPCELKRSAEPSDLDPKTKEQLYLITREAVNNAAKHAQANQITIQLTERASGWTLRIHDDGTGIQEPSSKENGMGLRILRHRTRLIEATLSITSKANQGTQIEIRKTTAGFSKNSQQMMA